MRLSEIYQAFEPDPIMAECLRRDVTGGEFYGWKIEDGEVWIQVRRLIRTESNGRRVWGPCEWEYLSDFDGE